MNISDKVIYKKIAHSKTAEESYRLFTEKEGLKKFFGHDHQVELRPFGKYEIYFLMDNPPGLKGSEGCKVLSFIPNRMLSFTWNAPPQYMDIRNSEYHTWLVLDFHDHYLELRHLGWPQDADWDPVFDYFDAAWDQVLDSFQKV